MRWLSAVLLSTLTVGSSRSSHAAGSPNPLTPPTRDPNDAPFMPTPGGGAQTEGRRAFDRTFAGSPARQRFQLTARPLFASFRSAFIGRPFPQRGGGMGLDLDFTFRRPLRLRLTGSYSAHPLSDQYVRNEEMDLVQTAAKGLLQTGHAAAAIVYEMDFGRVVPLLELGAGPVWVKPPPGVVGGQLGQECQGGNVCDFGLTCGADNVCQSQPLLTLHGGLGVDILLTRHLTLGAGVRYFAFLTAPAVFPIYLQVALRLGARF